VNSVCESGWAVLACGVVVLFIVLYKVALLFESVDEICGAALSVVLFIMLKKMTIS